LRKCAGITILPFEPSFALALTIGVTVLTDRESVIG
jgi:hypothetical protein